MNEKLGNLLNRVPATLPGQRLHRGPRYAIWRMTSEDCVRALGPLTSKWGFKTWQLLLGSREIVAWPYTWTEAFRLGLFLETGFGGDAGSVFTIRDARGFAAALAGRNVRTYAVSAIESITFRSAATRNKIEILGTDGTCDRYGVMYRSQTNEYRKALQSLYGNRFRERDLPRSLWGKLVKY